MSNTRNTLSLAQRITKPIPLAALGVLSLVVVSLATIAAVGSDVGSVAYLIIGTVAVVALATLIVAVSLSKGPPPAISGQTDGDNSPGFVAGNYVVNADAPAADSNLPAGVSITSKTKGDQSPAVVGGSYVVGGKAKDGEERKGKPRYQR